MVTHHRSDHRWRRQATQLWTKIRRVHVAVRSVAATLEKGQDRSARRRYALARHHMASVNRDIEALRAGTHGDGPSDAATTGRALTLQGAEAAAVALDVMLDAVVALGTGSGDTETEDLIGACIDAEQGYAEGAAVVRAAARAHDDGLRRLKQAFDTDGGVALRRRLEQQRSAIAAAWT